MINFRTKEEKRTYFQHIAKAMLEGSLMTGIELHENLTHKERQDFSYWLEDQEMEAYEYLEIRDRLEAVPF